MAVFEQSGYTWADGKHARIMHEGVELPIRAASSADEVGGYGAALVENNLTINRWRPFANQIATPTDASTDTTLTRMTVGSDGQTLSEGTDTGTHIVSMPLTTVTEEMVGAAKVRRKDMDGFRLLINDTGGNQGAVFDLRDGSIDSIFGGAQADIRALGNDEYLCRIYATPGTAAAGTLQLQGYSMTGSTNSYTGTNREVVLLEAYAHQSEAVLQLDLFGSASATAIAIAGHNLGSRMGQLTTYHSSAVGGNVLTQDSPTDDSPALCVFATQAAVSFFVGVSRAVVPEIAVARVGNPLVMQRPFYSGFTPAPMNRETEVRGNLSGSGQLMGRSIRRTILNTSAAWQHLTYAWVRANLDGPNGLIQRIEDAPFWIAWRPELVQDCDFVMRGSAEPPQSMGIRDLWQFSLSGEALAYE